LTFSAPTKLKRRAGIRNSKKTVSYTSMHKQSSQLDIWHSDVSLAFILFTLGKELERSNLLKKN